jgi:CMD domain protein
MSTKDIIDTLAGIEPGSALDAIRAKRVQARENAQKSYLSLFEPIDTGDFSLVERAAVAAFVTGLHGESPVATFYREKLAATADGAVLLEAITGEIARGKTSGPYGAYPAGPLSAEDKAGLIYRVSAERKPVVGVRLAAALDHAHLLVFRPRDVAAADMKALLAAGRTPASSHSLSSSRSCRSKCASSLACACSVPRSARRTPRKEAAS